MSPVSLAPFGLDVGVDALDAVAFLPARLAADAQRAADEVFVALTLVGAAVEVDASGGGQFAAAQLAHSDVARTDRKAAVKVDDPPEWSGLVWTLLGMD